MPTNPPDWSALMPVLPGKGPRAGALYAALRHLIETGLAPPGSKLPTTRDLAARLELSRGAAVTAFEMLKAEGFTEGRGADHRGHARLRYSRAPRRLNPLEFLPKNTIFHIPISREFDTNSIL